MKKIVYSILIPPFIISLLLGSCVSEIDGEAVLLLKYSESYMLPLAKGGLKFVPRWTLHEKEDTCFLAYHNIYSQHIEMYDFERKTYSRAIPLAQEGVDKVSVSEFALSENDIIILGRQYIYRVSHTDSIDGSVKSKTPIRSDEISSGNVPYENYYLSMNSNWGGESDFFDSKKGNCYLPIREEGRISLSTDDLTSESIVCEIDMKRKSINMLDIFFPDFVKEYEIFTLNPLWTDYIYPSLCVDEENMLIYNFRVSSKVYKYDLVKNQVIKQASINSAYTNNNMERVQGDVKSKKFINEVFNNRTTFGPVRYDKYRKLYYRIHSSPTEASYTNENESKKYYFCIFDQNFEKKGEVQLSDNLSIFYYGIKKDGIYFLSKEGTSEDVAQFEKYTITANKNQ
ncbi:MAG: DUF4221 family protein [Bacteroidota bacterium]